MGRCIETPCRKAAENFCLAVERAEAFSCVGVGVARFFGERPQVVGDFLMTVGMGESEVDYFVEQFGRNSLLGGCGCETDPVGNSVGSVGVGRRVVGRGCYGGVCRCVGPVVGCGVFAAVERYASGRRYGKHRCQYYFGGGDPVVGRCIVGCLCRSDVGAGLTGVGKGVGRQGRRYRQQYDEC